MIGSEGGVSCIGRNAVYGEIERRVLDRPGLYAYFVCYQSHIYRALSLDYVRLGPFLLSCRRGSALLFCLRCQNCESEADDSFPGSSFPVALLGFPSFHEDWKV
jgi:hypothetical protein